MEVIGGFLAGLVLMLTQHVGACTRPAFEHVTNDSRTTVAVPVEVGLNPPECS